MERGGEGPMGERGKRQGTWRLALVWRGANKSFCKSRGIFMYFGI